MNKTAIKNFAIWARNKLIADVRYRAGLVGITEQGIQTALPQSDATTEFYDIGTATPYAISGQTVVRQRRNLAEAIRRRAEDADYSSAYRYIMEEVAYTWFNRLIAVRFMEVNDYLPGRVRALSSESGKIEPDLVTTPFDAELNFTAEEERTVLQLKQDNKLDELFRLLFIKQCNALHDILPALFERRSDYTELLLNLSVVDQDGVVWRLTHDIPEEDFNVEQGGQVEIIGWLYQYYNTEPKAQVFARPSGQKIRKEDIPAATQLFTPDWIVRYMVENSLGRLWLEGHPGEGLRANWKYYLDEAEQEPEVQAHLEEIRAERRTLNPEDIKVIDPCMGSGHILVYAFDVLMQIYESQGYSPRDAAQSIVRCNLYGLDIDKRAAQLAYFAVMMKARQYDRRFLTRGIEPNVYEVQASSGKYPYEMGNFLLSKEHQETLNYLLELFKDAKEYGSLVKLEQRDYVGLLEVWKYTASQTAENVNMVLWYSAVEEIVPALIKQATVLSQKYDIVVTNPPYMGGAGMNGKLADFVKKNYPDSKNDLFSCFMEKADSLVKLKCYTSLITMESWMFLSSFEKLREKVNQTKTIINMVHMPYLGKGGTSLGINFGTAAVIMQKGCIKDYWAQYEYTVYHECDENGVPFVFPTKNERWKIAKQDNFSKIPGAPVAYWVSPNLIEAFSDKCFGEYYECYIGMRTGDNARFLRLWFEVSSKLIAFSNATINTTATKKWIPYLKGGDFRRWYYNYDYIVNWFCNGEEIKENTRKVYPQLGENLGWKITSESEYFKEGITFNAISSSKIGFKRFYQGAIFSNASHAILSPSVEELNYAIAFLNTKVVTTILELITPTINFTPSDIKKLPFRDIPNEIKALPRKLAEESVFLSKADWDSFETSWDFKRHPLVPPRSTADE